MLNTYVVNAEENIAIIEVPYKGSICKVTIDLEDLSIVKSIEGKWLLVVKNKKLSTFHFIHNLNRGVSLHRLILNSYYDDVNMVYFKDKDYTNLRKSNLSINTYEVTEELKQKKKDSYHNMSKEAKDRLIKGIKENRYSKKYSDKLSETKKGLNNPSNRLTPEIVREIRKVYSLGIYSQQFLADEFGIHRSTVADIVNYRTWNGLDENNDKEYRIFKEDKVIPFTLKQSLIQYTPFTNEDILHENFVLLFDNKSQESYMFCEKIGDFQLYVELRDKEKQFINSFEVIFPEYVRKQNIHNYTIIHQKPKRYANRHEIHMYMKIISSHLFYDELPSNDITISRD